MNDHNLDDLIIDNINPKNSKTKSFLTIIALAIVVLIVAIILTKIILKDPHAKIAIDEEENVELISPDLTLQSTPKEKPVTQKVVKTESETVKKALSLQAENEMPTVEKSAEAETKKPTKEKPETVKITKEFSQEPNVTETKNTSTKLSAEKKTLTEKKITEKKETHAKKTPAINHLAKEKTKQATQTKKETVTKNTYFIQVGSFTQTPSTRFLSVIKNSGFNYKITPTSSTGTKKLLIGPYGSRAEVDTALVRVRDRINKSAFVVKK